MHRIVITGASGFIGKKLTRLLSEKGFDIIAFTRSPEKTKRSLPYIKEAVQWNAEQNMSAECEEYINGAYAVINLAGESVAKRWNDDRKKSIMESRKNGTIGLVKAINNAENPPEIFFSASAIGIYGSDSGTTIFDENSSFGSGFLADVCIEWEKQALLASGNTRVIIGRIGVVLDPNEGALSKMLPAFKLYLGGPIGDGNQWLSWIHPHDLIAFIIYSLENFHVHGIYNLTAPQPITMGDFSSILAQVLHRPSWLSVPDIALSILMGDGAIIATGGQNVHPSRTIQSGFVYEFKDCKEALIDLLSQ